MLTVPLRGRNKLCKWPQAEGFPEICLINDDWRQSKSPSHPSPGEQVWLICFLALTFTAFVVISQNKVKSSTSQMFHGRSVVKSIELGPANSKKVYPNEASDTKTDMLLQLSICSLQQSMCFHPSAAAPATQNVSLIASEHV